MPRFHEIRYRFLEPFRYALYRRVRRDLRHLIKAYRQQQGAVALLDVGARNSPYTIGLHATVTILDVPRETELHDKLNLGMTDDILAQLRNRRSNIEQVILQNFLTNDLPDKSFDVITAVEVIEHIEDDATFVQQAYRLLRPGGVCYLTTPNGIAIPRRNPDHVRHYTKQELSSLLYREFDEVSVHFALREDRFRQWEQRLWDIRDPIATIKAIAGSMLNGARKVRYPLEGAHLIATGFKRV